MSVHSSIHHTPVGFVMQILIADYTNSVLHGTNLQNWRLDKRRISSNLVETFKRLNGFYNINRYLFFELDDGGHRGDENSGGTCSHDCIVKQILCYTSGFILATCRQNEHSVGELSKQ